MAQSVWQKFDKNMDTEALKEDTKQASENGDFPEVPFGTYEVKIEKLELTESKTGKPMLTCWMKIVDGQYKNQRIFMNQVMHVGFGIHKANEFLRALDTSIDVHFDSFKQFNEMVLDIHEEIDGQIEYAVEYGEDKKGYNTFEIKEVFDAE